MPTKPRVRFVDPGHHVALTADCEVLFMRRLLIMASALFVGSIGQARAGLLIYTEAATISGTIGSTSFTNAFATITTSGDTANITPVVIGETLYYENPGATGATTIDISGVGTATFSGGDVYGAYSYYTGFDPGHAVAGIGDLTLQDGVLENVTDDPTYNLSTPIVLTGSAAFNPGIGFQTTLGTLILTAASGDGTFTAGITSVPEPGTLVMIGIGILFPLGHAWRRRKRLAHVQASMGRILRRQKPGPKGKPRS
jgi:hypothetical protein